jgi:uncharacterized membrane protein HdeD (DUF308 family)
METLMVEVPDRVKGVILPHDIRGHWWIFLIEGIVLILLGIGAILVPVVAGLAVALFLGWLFLIGGIVGGITALARPKAPGFWWALLSSIVTLIAGLLLIGWPFTGVISLTAVLAAFLLVDGIASMAFALSHRGHLTRGWGWLFVNGIIDLVMAGIIIWLLPVAAFWALGLIIGIDFIFGGSSLVGMAVAAKSK